jgi:hypothetical protein
MARNELEGRSFWSNTHGKFSFEEEVKWKDSNNPMFLQFIVDRLVGDEEQMQSYLKLLKWIEHIFSNLFKLFEFLFEMSFLRTQGSFFLILYLLLLKFLFQKDNVKLVKIIYL